LAPRRTSIFCRQTQRKVLLKRRGEKGGGTRPKLSKQTRNKVEKTEEKKKQETTVYGTLERGNPLRSKKKSV